VASAEQARAADKLIATPGGAAIRDTENRLSMRVRRLTQTQAHGRHPAGIPGAAFSWMLILNEVKDRVMPTASVAPSFAPAGGNCCAPQVLALALHTGYCRIIA
jgi:hypothetical protein